MMNGFSAKNSLEMTKFTPMRDTIIQYTLARKNERMSKWNEQREKKEHTTRHTPERKMENRKLYLVSSQNHTLTILFWNLFEIQIFILSHFTSILSTFCSFSRLKFEVKKRQIFSDKRKKWGWELQQREKKKLTRFLLALDQTQFRSQLRRTEVFFRLQQKYSNFSIVSQWILFNFPNKCPLFFVHKNPKMSN